MQISQKQSQTWLQVVLHGKCDLMKLISEVKLFEMIK